MKIALLSAFYPYRGGIAQFGAMLFRALEKENEVKAYTFKRQYPSFLFPGKSQFVEPSDQADPVPAERVLDAINPISFRKTAIKINSFDADVVISQYWMTFFSPAIGGVHKRINKKTKRISILHNVIPHEKRFYDNRANAFFLKNNDGFVVLSDAVLADLLSLKPDAKYIRIDHPVYSQFGEKRDRNDALLELKLDPAKKYVLFFGFIRDYKGLDLLLESMADLNDDIELIVAGEVYGSFERYDKIIQESNIRDRVHLFNQYISDDDVATFFSAANVCVLPYKSATQSGITAISNHFDLPVIVTDVGGLKETVEDGRTGYVIDHPSTHLIGNAIKHYFLEDKQSEFAVNIGQEKQNNSWGNFAQKITDFVQTL